jgi:hypothetical protein
MNRLHGLKEYVPSLHVCVRGVLTAGLAVIILGSAAPARAGLVINPIFDSSITGDPNAAAIEGVINSAIQEYQAKFNDPITVNIEFHSMTTGLGQSSTFFATGTYSQFLAALQADATTSYDAIALAHLAAGPNNPVNGSTLMNVKTANLRAIGINVNPPAGQPDGFIGLNTHITFPGSPGSSLTYFLKATVQHEIDEVLGLGSALPNPPSQTIFPQDLYRYDASGNRTFTTTSTVKAFFSIDGTTRLAQFDNQNDGGDFGDWQSNPLPPNVKPQVQDAFATPFAQPALGLNELIALDVIGYDLKAAVPEPSAVALLGTGMLVVSGFSLWRRKRHAG